MYLNTIKPSEGSTHSTKRLGRGIGSGLGKTSGKGHKGQKARSGGYHKVGFEGGQMPIQRRLPKRGFRSLKKNDTAQVRIADLAKVDADVIDLIALKNAGIALGSAVKAKIYLSGKLDKAVFVKGLAVSAGAKAAIESMGGRIEE